MTGYYTEKISGRRLELCYELATPRVRQYLEAEIQHVLTRMRSTDVVLELGCGYGRVALRLAEAVRRVVGIDPAGESLEMARELAGVNSRCEFLNMDALDLRYSAGWFDAVICIQNGICAFGVNQEALLREALRVTRPRGIMLFSTYSDRFWRHRLAWFQAQAEADLIGPIDYDKSGDGVIVCRDGFRAGRFTPEDWRLLCSRVGCDPEIIEVDESSVFCEILKEDSARR
ncbi:MAG: class I SAM-dependent methyltransferase [Candidatus Aegiribacteria sp.]|nr:class I SAM-dependent methyltransferase [Candidatus Aegiribacteria sp.]